ncbi:hypothetical protein L873DRAFT_1788560 [Choiromyces venosus 120613-1]|uniref:SH3 domain-containing protein n=1 Tax=Choiromyces venosus 120613-1 TaxID=1336337 RepID=A0A3N4JXU7_9PEZI|nr:hypothetical protein L873DRAFT_1788560 [Choiromyces venosus 120613-1]
MPWIPLPRIAFAIATHPFNPTTRDDLPLELGDELYIIESCNDGQWFRGYLVAPPSLLAGLTSTKGATLEARVFSGIFPAACVDVKEYLTTEVPLLPEDAVEGGDYDYDNNEVSQRRESVMINGSSHHQSQYGDSSGVHGHSQHSGGSRGRRTESSSNGNSNSRVSRTKSSRSKRNRRSMMITPPPRHPSENGYNRPRPAAPVPMLKVGDETSSFESEPLVDEIASCLREWHAANLHELLLNSEYPLLDEISALVHQLDLSRRQLLHSVLTKAELVATRERTVWALVRGNKLLSREIIVRDPNSGRILTGDDSSVDITTLQSQMSLLEYPPAPSQDGITLHHLLMEHKAFVGMTNEPVTLVFYLATKQNIPISESFTVSLNAQGTPLDTKNLGKMQTLFTDLSSRDATEDMFLVVRVYSTISVVPSPVTSSGKGHPAAPSETTFGTVKHSAMNGATSPGKSEQKLKGRVSVLFSPRPKTSGNEDSPIESHANDENLSPHPVPPLPNSPIVATHMTQQMPQRVTFQKALGVGVLDVGRFVRQDQAIEQIMRIFVPAGMGSAPGSTEKGHGGSACEKGGGKPGDGEDWDKLIRDVIESRTGKLSVPELLRGESFSDDQPADMRLHSEKSPKADRLHLYLRPFTSPDADSLIKATPTLLHNINCAQKIGFSGAPTKPRSDIYITLGNPILPRHALLLHPKLGSCALPASSYFNSLQMSLEVRRPNGEKIKDCIFSASNTTGVTVWKSVVVARDESWNQTIRLALDEEDVPSAHLFMVLSSVPHAPTALAWLPLWDNEAFLRDGDYSLLLHKYDEWTSSPISTVSGNGNGYLNQPWTPGDEGWAAALSMGGAAAMIKVKTYLCSTKFSQDDVLLSLLQWKNLKESELIALLKKVVFVPEMEVVKLLREVFDALFGILVEYAKKMEMEDLVFIALVTVLGIVYDRRFHLEPIVDIYAEKHFDYPFAASCLLRSFTRLLQDPTNPESSRRLRSMFKVGRHIFQFIAKAREQQIAKEATIGLNGGNGGNQTFTKDLQVIFKLLENLMRNNAAMLVGSQTLAVQHFHTWLPEMAGLVSREQILLIAIDFMDACSDVRGKLVLYKLVLIINYSRSSLFSQPEDRRALTLNTVRWLAPHWGKTHDVTGQWREQVRLCCSVLAAQVEELGEEVSEYIPKIIDSYRAIQATGRHERETFSLLFPRTYPFPAKSIPGRPIFDEALIELAAILAAVSSIPTGLHLDLSEDDLARFLMDDLQVHMSILSCDAFPESWLSVHIYQHKSTMRTLETLAGILVDSFLPDPDDAEKFNTELWQAFFTTLLMLVGSDALALETFPEQKRRAVWKVAGDVREQGADLLRRTWEAIGWETSSEDKRRFGIEKMGGYQVQYVPGLVAPIVELCLSVHEGLRSVAVEVLQTMVVSEWTLSQDLSVIQAEMIDSLDRLFKSKKLTESITQKLFIADLIELFEPLSLIPNDPLTVKVRDLLHTIDQFLDLLVAVHNTPLGEAYHIMDTLRLMEFLKDMRKEDMFIRYVHQLVNVQLESQNYVEAGLSLQLHADLYPWGSTEKVPALVDPPFPEQTAFERREALFLEMIKFFEDGKSWENALDTYKELAHQYENVVFDYAKLGKCHRAMAKIHENILNGDKFSPQFFRVAYLGMGFPIGLRDRQFIVQGNHWEKLMQFSDRIQQQHPSAKIVASGEIDSVEGQFIHVTAVRPEHDLMHPVFQRTKVPPNTREFLLQKRPRSFSCSRPLPGNDMGRPSSWWTEKTIYNTAERFPTILRRSEILSISTATVSPVENAIEAVTTKTRELSQLEKRYADMRSGDGHNLNPLSMSLTGAVDSPVNGGVGGYRELIDDERVAIELRNALRAAILDYVSVLKKCLAVHGRLVANPLMPMHENMMRFFEKNYTAEIAALAPSTLPPPIPISPGQWRTPLYSPSTPGPFSKRSTDTTRPTPLVGSTVTSTAPSIAEDSASVVGSTRGRLASMIFGANTNHGKDGILTSITATATTTTTNGHHNHNHHHRKEESFQPLPAPPNTSSSRSHSGSVSTTTRSASTSRSRSRSKSIGRRRTDSESYPPPPPVPSMDSYHEEMNKSRVSTSSGRPPGSSGSGIVNSMERGVGSVRKRFSMLKLGKKQSRSSVKDGGSDRGHGHGGWGGDPRRSEVSSVAEE